MMLMTFNGFPPQPQTWPAHWRGAARCRITAPASWRGHHPPL